jgi:hypothetical protein
MLERIGNLAEKLATNVSQSRRGFLARVGQGALGVAGALGGLLALPGAAQAASSKCCYYECEITRDNRYSFVACGPCKGNGCGKDRRVSASLVNCATYGKSC